jgi:heptosyltransferase-2
MGPRVLIVKLGALGDVVRTGCLLPALAARPEPPHVTWLTAPGAVPLVERMAHVHRVLPFNAASLAHLELEHFDTVICLDKEPAPCAVATRVNAAERLGCGCSRYGTVHPFNEAAEYLFQLGLDNDEKFFRNAKSYPQLIFEALGWDYAGEEYRLTPTARDRGRAAHALRIAGVPDDALLVGINPGAGEVFANKAWRPEGYAALIAELELCRREARVVMLGGTAETELIEGILRQSGTNRGHHPGTAHDLGTFAALVERCAVTVSGDTLAMHLALATGRRAVAIFGPTCPQEIDMFGRGEKIVTPIGCAPCYRRQCDVTPSCQEMIASETVLAALLRQLDAARENETVIHGKKEAAS